MNNRITIVGTNGNKSSFNFERLYIRKDVVDVECEHRDFSYNKKEIKSITVEFNN